MIRSDARRSYLRTIAVVGLLWPAAGCVSPPHLGKDQGREAVVWQHQPLAAPATPTAPAVTDTERALLAELHDAEGKAGDDLAVADALYRLAILRRQQGAAVEAEQLYRRALDIRERKQGPNHADVATVLNNLAVLEAAQGNYAAAQPLLERALNIREAALGDQHELTAQSLNNLALLYAAQGNAGAAEPLYQRALSILEKPTSHPGELDRVLENYATLLHETGRDGEADKLEARTRGVRAGASPPSDVAH